MAQSAGECNGKSTIFSEASCIPIKNPSVVSLNRAERVTLFQPELSKTCDSNDALEGISKSHVRTPLFIERCARRALQAAIDIGILADVDVSSKAVLDPRVFPVHLVGIHSASNRGIA